MIDTSPFSIHPCLPSLHLHTSDTFIVSSYIPSSDFVLWPFVFLSQASIPFAVIGSNQLIEVKGKKIRGRLYPWGVVEVENPEHNDFLKLRTMLVWVSLAIKSPKQYDLGKESLLQPWHKLFLIKLVVKSTREV